MASGPPRSRRDVGVRQLPGSGRPHSQPHAAAAGAGRLLAPRHHCRKPASASSVFPAPRKSRSLRNLNGIRDRNLKGVQEQSVQPSSSVTQEGPQKELTGSCPEELGATYGTSLSNGGAKANCPVNSRSVGSCRSAVKSRRLHWINEGPGIIFPLKSLRIA